ncbi:cell division protein SepF [uncultured Selenomonas sp.]|uniref:cell division protein SepF n=1 Tax=uncultured Selenomonas sp. TaxID=159275 RepID=UPI00261C5D54|nr:cell division protein SepF [uncultured Selenomonas sp.]
MDFLKRVTDFLMPVEEEEVVKTESAGKEEQEETQERMMSAESYDERKVSNGASVSYASAEPPMYPSPTGTRRSLHSVSGYSAPRTHVVTQQERPKLTVHTTQIPSLNVKIYVPRSFDQVQEIADDLKAGRAVLVNYERVELEEQRRLCDFINGVCYIMNGEVKRVSTAMVLYAPDGVNVYEAEPIPLRD